MLSRTSGLFLLFCVSFAFLSHTAFAATVPADACLYALDATAPDAFQIAGAQSIYTSCGVVSESSSSSAFEMEGSETLYLQDHAQVSVVGGAQLNGQKLWDTINNLQTQAVQVTSPGDPFASQSMPTSGTIVSTSHASYDMNNKPHNNTLSPGVYCGGLTVGNTNGATFTFSPGVYVMAGGGLTLNSQAVVAGTGVTFYITSSTGWGCSASSSYTPLTISGQVTANLSAPTSGTYNGILFLGNRTGCSTAGSCQDQINGGSTTVLNGALYFKSDQIEITGSNASGYTMLVADKVYINGNSTFETNGSPFDGITVTVSPSSVALNPNQTQQFTATVSDASNPGLTWTLSPAVGTISSSGLYMAPATITAQQTVTVTATSQDDSAKHGTATITLYPPVSVAVTPASATLYQGQMQQLTAVVANNPNTTVTWSISPAVGSVSASGLYTAPESVTTSQTVTVTATSVADPTKFASTAITLSPPITVSVSPTAATLYASQAQQLTATVTNTTNTAVTWSVSPAGAGVGTVTTSGLYTAPSGISTQQTVTVTATSVANSSVSAPATITLEPPVAVSGVSPSSAALYAGQTQTFSATVINTGNTAVTWSISPAGAGSISSSGLYTAPSTITSQQTVTVTATSQASPTATDTATITLYPPVAVSVSPTSSSLYGGGTQQFSATVSNAVNIAVNWSVSGAGSISSSGLYTAPASVTSQQSVAITATSQAYSSVSSSVTITLYPPVALAISPATVTLYASGTQQFYATVSNTTNTAVTWTVSGPGSIDATGLYTAPATIDSQQTVTVTATSQANSAVAATATITLYPPITVSVTPTTANVYANGTVQLSATVANTSNTAVTWTVSGSGSISSAGLYTAPASITSQQTVTITATSQANSSIGSSAIFTLYPSITVAVSPTTITLYTNGTQQFSATVSNATNTAVIWTVSGPGSVDSTGLYTAPATITGQQTVTLTATSQANSSVSATATVTLLPQVAVSVTPAAVTLSASQTQAFTATVTNTSNTAVTWTISPAGAGTIDSTGLYTAPSSISAQQTVTVTATSAADITKSASATVTLSPTQCATSAFSHRRIVTIDHTKVPNTDQTDFPMLIAGTYPFLASVANGGEVQNANGYDIIFTSDPQGQVPLDYEIDSYNGTTGAAAFWVRIPTLSHTADTPVYMWYGNTNITASQENKAGVWRNKFLSVYHLGNGSTLGVADSGSAGYNLSGSASSVGGVIGGGAGFNGSASLVYDGVSAYPSVSSPVTIEGWVNITPNTTGGDIFGYGANSANGSRIAFGTSSTNLTLEFENMGLSVALPSVGAWHHIVGVYAGGTLSTTSDRIYVDGVPLAETNDIGTPAIATNEFKIGGIPTVGFCCTFTGSVDEVRVSSGTRSADWVATEYNSESSPSTFYSLSAEDALVVVPTTAYLYGSQSLQLAAVPTSSCTTANWTITSGNGNVSSTGLYIAPATITSQQSVLVTATTRTQSASTTITLMPPVGVTINPASATIVDGRQPLQFAASVANSINTAVTWSISPSGVGSISATGLYTAPQPLPVNQTVTVTATSVADSSASASAILSLNPTVNTAPPTPATCAATGYTQERTIVIDHTKVANADQVNFPFLFSATDPAFATIANGGKVTSYTGTDILFTLDPNGTEKLDYEIQSYDPVHGQIIAWVRIPTLSHTSNTAIYLFYGNSNISVSQANPTGVWDSNYQSVYHLANLTSNTVADSTANNSNGTATNVTTTTGSIGGAAGFNGRTSIIQLPTGVTGSSPRTISAWVNTANQAGCIYCTGLVSRSPYDQAFSLYANEGETGNVYLQTYGSDNFTAAGTLLLNTWNYVTLSYSGGPTTTSSMQLYINGSMATSYGGNWNVNAVPNTYNGNFTIGLDPANSNLPFSGSIDEVEVSNTARSASWILTEYQNQSSPSTFSTLYPGATGIIPSAINLYAGQTQQFAAATGACESPGVIWTGPAGMPGTLSQSGFYLAPASIDTQQNFTLTATTLGDASQTLSTTVTLLPGISVSVTPSLATLTAGQTQQFTASVTSASNPNVTWTIAPVGVGSISSTGLYTAPSSLTASQAVNITATSLADSTQSATATVTLPAPAPVLPVTISVTPTGSTLYGGQTQQLTAQVLNTTNTAVTWQVSPTGVGSISTSGLYTAPASISAQQAVTITVTSQANPNQSAVVAITLAPTSCASNGYSYERTIVIDHNQVPNTDQTNFPFLFSTTDPLFASTANGGHVTNSNGSDIIFSTDPNGLTALNYELEKYDPVTGQIIAWVNIPTISHTSDTILYVFYGNPSVTTPQQNPVGVWDSNYGGVWHLAGNGTTVSTTDSTANGNNAAALGSPSVTQGPLGPAAALNGGSFDAGQTPSVWPTHTGTMSIWMDSNSFSSYAIPIGDGDTSGFPEYGSMFALGAGGRTGYLTFNIDNTYWGDGNGVVIGPLLTNQWYSVTGTWDGNSVNLYEDGVLVASTPQAIDASPSFDLRLGWGLAGSIQEGRVSGIARSADWIATEYHNESSPATFYSLGSEGELASPSSVALYASQSQQFTALRVCNAVTWSMPSGSPGQLIASGLYTAPASITTQETITLTATSQATSSVLATATVTLMPPVSVSVTPPSATLLENQSQQFTATVANSLNSAVSWSVSPSGVGSIDASGAYTAPLGVAAPQMVTITATSQEDLTKSASATITITPALCVATGFGYQRAVIIDHTKVPNTDQTNFPFLFNTVDPDLATTDNGGHVANANGYDIYFSLDPNGLTKLDHEVEQYNPATGQLTAWVRIPTLSHSADTVIYLFYGNQNITTSQANVTGVWDNDTQAVYHLGNLTQTTAPDSTIFGNAGATNSVTESTGWIAVGAGFNGTGSYFQVPSTAFSNYPTGQYSNYGIASSAANTTFASTFGVWFKTATAGGGILTQVPATSCTDQIFGVCLFNGPTEPGYNDPSGWDPMLYLDTNGKLQDDGITSSTAYNDNNWHYAVMTHATDGTKILYVDGQNVGMLEQNFPAGYSTGYSYFVGTAYTFLEPTGNWNWLYFNGSLDEVSVSDIPRSADWIKAQFNNQSSPSTFYHLSSVGSLALTPLTGSLYASQTQQFVVAGPCGLAVNWSLFSGSPGTLSSSGLYTAPAIFSTSQTVTITASNAATGTVIGSATITLLPAPSPITLAANAASPYTVGTSEIFTARLEDQSGTPEAGVPVTFTITGTNAAIAKATTDSSGTATYSYTGPNSGADNIQATAVVNGVVITSSALSVTWNLAITPPVQASLTLLPQPTLGQGGLVGAFTDNTGAVIEPIAIGSSRTFLVPAGATQLQLGIDDTLFSDNGGTGYVVNVNGTPVTVAPTTMPWMWVAGGLNDNLQFGFSDGTAPVVAATGLTAGQSIAIAYQSGTVSVGASGRPFTNANGDQTQITGTNISTGLYFPTLYTTASAYPVGEAVDWSALVTDANGQPVANTQVTLYVSGANPGQYSTVTDSTGTATFAYTGAFSGMDTLQAQSGSLSSQTGSITWQTYAAESSHGSVNLSLFSTDVSLQAWNIYATDASGNPLANANVGFYVSGVDNFQSSGTTDITGHVTFDYFHTNPGPYTVVAVDSVNNAVVKSTPVNGTWTVPATGVNNPVGSQISINISTTTTIALPTNSVALTTTITDSTGLTPTTTWTQVSGPGTVTFADPIQASTTATFSQDGVYVLQLSASDTSTIASTQVTITVNPPLVNNYSQGWFASPLYGSQATGVIPVTIEPGVTLTGGTLVYYPDNNVFDVTVLNSNTVGSGQVGVFDTTQLPNGSYVLELYATNSKGVSQYNDINVNVVGSYKPGRVTTTVTDLVVPATGLAISIQRRYDSLNAGVSSDFGYGWSLGTSVGLTVDGHNDVTFTLNGQTHTFFFTPQPFGASFFQLGTYSVDFTPDSGIHGTLTDDYQGCPLDFVEPDGSLWYCVGGGLYQPSGYIYTDPSGTKYTISSAGNLQSVVDIGGNTLTVTANGITSSTGLSVPFVRDAQGRITQITDPQGNNYVYTYDASGNLATVKYPGITQSSSYSYNLNHLYLSGTDFRGNALPTSVYYQSSFDANGNCTGDCDSNGLPLNNRLKSVTDSLNETTGYAYNLTTNTTTITYPADGSGNVGTETMVYDSTGNLLSSTDPLGHTTTNVYDSTGNLLSVTDPLGHTNSYTYDALGNRTTSTYPQTATSTNTTSATLYNQYSEPTSSIDELGNVRTYNYDANFWPSTVTDSTGVLMSSLFNSAGQMQAGAIGYDIAAQPARASQFTYDTNGNRTSTTDALGRVTVYNYDSLGRKTSMVEPFSAGGSAVAATTTYQYDQLGNLLQTSAPLGRVTSSAYDSNNNKVSDTDARGNVTTYTYDSLNRLVTTTYPTTPATTATNTYDFRGNIVTQTDQAGNVTQNQYDVAGRLSSTTRAYGTPNATTTSYTYYADGRKQAEADSLGHATTYTYDVAGHLIATAGVKGTVRYGYDNAGNQVSMTDANGHTTQYQYDVRKRLMQTTYPDGTTTKNAYDGPGNLTGVTDQAGKVVNYTYDAANQLQTVVQTASPSAQNTTAYGYDPLGNLASSSDANSHITLNGYDLLSEITAKTLPDGSLTETRTYDAAGNLQTLTHFNDVTTTYTYDSLNRLLSQATPGEVTVSHTYTATGKYASTTDASGVTTYTYDSMDRLIAKATPEGTLNYTFNAIGKVASIASGNANGASMAYSYDSLDRLSTVVDGRLAAGQNTTNYTYDAANNLATATYPNGLTSTFTYDSLNRLTELATPPIADYRYTLGVMGLRSGVTEQSGRAANWSYDGIYRLTNEAISLSPAGNNGSLAYGLDPVGNRQTETSSVTGISSGNFSFNADDQLSTETYDANGNTLTTGGKSLGYDAENKLVSMNGGAVSIVYDGFGNRVAKTVGGVTTKYLVEDDVNPTGYPQVFDELTGSTVTRTYTYGLQRIDEQQVLNTSWTTSFYGYDGFGNVRQLTNASGTVTDTYEYDAFGNKINSTGTTPNNYLYRSEQYDPDLNLYYLRARYYNPLTGRFMSRDPEDGKISDPRTLHKYLYADGDPINGTDPSGQDTIEYAELGLRVADVRSNFSPGPDLATCAKDLFSLLAQGISTRSDISEEIAGKADSCIASLVGSIIKGPLWSLLF